MSLQAQRYTQPRLVVVDPVSDLFWEAMEAANDSYDDECFCPDCSDRAWEERFSWEQHREMMAEEYESTLVSVWYEHHVVYKRCFDANGVCDGSCDDLARFVAWSST